MGRGKVAPPLGSAAELRGGEGAAAPRSALVPLTNVRADTVSAGGSVSRPLPRFDARRDASRLGLDLACGYRSEGLLGMPGGSGKKPLPKPLPHPKNGFWAILGPHFVGSRPTLPAAPNNRQRAAWDQCMDSEGCLPAVFREHRVLRVVEKGPSPFFQERNPVKTSWIKDEIGVFSNGPFYPVPPARPAAFSASGPAGAGRCWSLPSAPAGTWTQRLAPRPLRSARQPRARAA